MGCARLSRASGAAPFLAGSIEMGVAEDPYEQSDRWRAPFQLVAEAKEVIDELGAVKRRR